MDQVNLSRGHCRTCKWFDSGRCRRHPPTAEGYPTVLESDWCGDYEPKEQTVTEGADTLTLKPIPLSQKEPTDLDKDSDHPDLPPWKVLVRQMAQNQGKVEF